MRKALYILGQLSDLDIEWMITHGHQKDVPADQTIIQQGEAVDSLYIVLDGNFSVVDENIGEELARLKSGAIVGEMSFVDEQPPSATVTALDAGSVFVLPRAALTRKLEDDDGFAARFYRALSVFLSDRLRSTVSRLGYGEPVDEGIDEETMQEGELDPGVLDSVHLAGARFERILKRLAEA